MIITTTRKSGSYFIYDYYFFLLPFHQYILCVHDDDARVHGNLFIRLMLILIQFYQDLRFLNKIYIFLMRKWVYTVKIVFNLRLKAFFLHSKFTQSL